MKKTLEKVLSLTLVLCMCLSLMLVGTPAAAAAGTTIIEDTDPAVTTDDGNGGEWGTWEAVKFLAMSPETSGPSFAVTFTGTNLAVYGQKAYNGPIMTVSIDGTPVGEADFYASETSNYNALIWSITELADEEHTAEFRFEGKANADAHPDSQVGRFQAAFNYFEIQDGGSEPPAPTEVELIEDTDSRVATDNGAGEAWAVYEDLSYTTMEPTLLKGEKGASVTVTFQGTSLTLYGQKATNGPVMAVTVDGVKVNSADFYAGATTGSSEKVWAVTGLANKEHTAVFTYEGRCAKDAAPDAQGNKMQAAINYFKTNEGGTNTPEPELKPTGPVEPEVPDVGRVVYENADAVWDEAPAAGACVVDPQSPAATNGLYTWKLVPGTEGSFGVAFNVTEAGFNAIYVENGKYMLKPANGEAVVLAEGAGTGTDPVKIQVLRIGDLCTLYMNGVEVGAVTSADLGTEGQMGLYNPGTGAGTVTANAYYEVFYYENDFDDPANLGSWTTGDPVQTEDGRLRLHMKAVSNAILEDAPVICDGIYEFDLENSKAEDGRLGLLFRAEDDKNYQGLFYDAGSWVWLNGTAYGGMSVSVPLNEVRSYHIKMTVRGSSVNLEIDGEPAFAGTISGLGTAYGRFGLRKQWNNADVTLDNLKISELVDIRPDDVAAVEETIGSGMKVTMDKVFPRVIRYELEGKTLPGNLNKTYGLNLNGKTYYPMVSAQKTDADTLVYTLRVPTIGLTLKLSYTVKGNALEMKLLEVTEKADFRLENMSFADAALVSTDPADASASHASAQTTGGWFGSTDVIYDSMDQVRKMGTMGRGYAMLASNGLAATVNNSGVDASSKLNVSYYAAENGSTVGTIADGTLLYRSPLDLQEGTHHEIWSTTAICGDYNKNGTVTWQDAAANYRNIRTEIKGMDTMKDNMMYITMNFASQTQQPFLRTLDLGKTLYNYTDGFGQMIMHKGFAAEGHDDSHADYGGHVGVRQGGAKDFNYVIEEGAKYNIQYGIHINVNEHHPDAFYFNPSVMNRPLGANWGWIDQAYWVNEAQDILSGNRNTNMDRLEETLPNLGFVYVDIYNGMDWKAENLYRKLNSMGCIVGTEFGGSMEMGAAFTHWGRDRSYPNHGNNSKILRFVKNDLDIFVTDALFNTGMMPRVGSWGNQNNVHEAVTDFYNNVLPAKYMQHFAVLELTDDFVQFTDGVRSEKKGSNVELTRNGKLLATWSWKPLNPEDATWAASDTGDAVVFIPWYAADSAAKNPNEAGKIYYWNPKGTETTWDMPENWTGNADVYRLDRDCKTLVDTVEVKDGKITLNLEAGLGYVLYPTDKEPTVAADFGAGSGLVNAGFEDRTLSGWTVEGTAKAEVIRTEKNWEPRLAVSGEGSAKLSQTITGLEGGREYILYLFAETGAEGRLTASVKTGAGTAEASVTNTVTPHYDQSKYFGETFRKVRVVFSVPQGETTAKLTLTATPNGGTVYADDVTLFDALTATVPQAGTGAYKNYAFYEDFENVEQGLGSFTYSFLSMGATHLAERRKEAHQFKDYVLDGSFSLKTNEFGHLGEAMRTHPGLIFLEADAPYEFGFLYETGINNAYSISLRKADGTAVATQALTATELNGRGGQVKLPFTPDTTGEYYITIDYVGDIQKSPTAPDFEKPEGSNMEYIYMSLDNVYVRRAIADLPVESIQLDPQSLTLDPGQEAEIRAAVTPADAADPTLTWTTSDEKVAIVADGLVTAVGKGTAVITAQAQGGISASCTVEVTLDTAEAEAALDAARAAKKDILVTDRPAEEVEQGVQFVSPAADGALTEAIAAAQKALAEAKTPAQVQAAAADLLKATETYKAAIETGTYVQPPYVNPFEDVHEKDWFYEPVQWAVENGITAGATATRFAPGKDCTRAQAVTFLWRLAGEPKPQNAKNPFTDLNEKEYYMDAILWAVEQGITQGVTATRFAPNKTCTRAQIVTFLWRYAGKPTPATRNHPFTDLNEKEYYMDPILWAVENGITAGVTATTFAPTHNCTRGQIVTFLYRAEKVTVN